MRLVVQPIHGAPTAPTPAEAALAWADPPTTVAWAQERDNLAVVVLAPMPPAEPHAVLCRHDAGWTVVVAVNQRGFIPYDGSSPPWIKETHNPPGVGVSSRDAGSNVSAVRVRYTDGLVVEELVVDGRWHVARWNMRMWGGDDEDPRPTVAAILVDGSWQAPVTPDLAMTEQDVFAESPVEIDAHVWALFDHLNSEDPLRAWALVRQIIDHVDDEDLGLLAAGQLENIFREEGEVFFPFMAATAREDPRVARALAGIWAYDAPMRGQLDALLKELGVDPRAG